MNKISDLLLSPKTTLPALLTVAGAPVYLASLLVPIRESGALLPQALYAKLLENNRDRHKPWRLGIALQLFSSVVMLFAGFFMHGLAAGIVIVGSLVVWSLSRALCSLMNKDIQGIHLREGDRGKLIGSAASVSSFVTALIGVLSLMSASTSNSVLQKLDLVYAFSIQVNNPKLVIWAVLAFIAQIVCIVIMWPLKTQIDDTVNKNIKIKKDSTSIHESLLNIKNPLTQFIVMRSLFSHSALMAPIYILAYEGDVVAVLAYLIIAQATASFLSSYIWGALSDYSALLCMQLGGLVTLLASFVLGILLFVFTELLAQVYWIAGLFFLLSIGHAGIRTGRKIYSLDIAQDHTRTKFVATSNSAVGGFILLAGFCYSALMFYSTEITLLIMVLALILGLVISLFVQKEK